MPVGDTCIAFKAVNGNKWVYAGDDDWIWCDGDQAGTSAKWAGWNTGVDAEWTVDSVVYHHDSANIGASKPIVLGTALVDAR